MTICALNHILVKIVRHTAHAVHLDIENLWFGVGDVILQRLLREPTQLAYFETIHQMRSHFTLNKSSVIAVVSSAYLNGKCNCKQATFHTAFLLLN